MVKRKYNKKKRTDGFKSELEACMWKALVPLKRRGYEVTYERDRLHYTLPRSYTPDYTVVFPDGRIMFIEVKGYFRIGDLVKMRAVKRDNPDADIRLCFAVDNRISKKTKMRYSDWAIKNGFPYSVGDIPKEWFS